MKIRTDYVSNSSSSSFVFSNMDVFDFFDISKKDILDALVDAYEVKGYKKAKSARLKSVKEHPDWHEDDLKYGSFGPFYVYDLRDPTDKKEAVARWGGLLKEWTATNCKRAVKRDGRKCVMIDNNAGRKFLFAIEGIAEIYNISRYELEDVAKGGRAKQVKRFVRTVDKDPKTGLYGHFEPINKELVALVRDMYKTSGVMTNLDVIRAKCARFFVHADDNELCGGKFGEYGQKDDCSWDKDAVKHDWTSESNTFDRVCEIVLTYLVKNGRIRPTDPKFLEFMKVDDQYLTKKDKETGSIYAFADGKELSWSDLKRGSLTWNMHEG